MPNNPVQVILNADNFITAREVNPGGSQKEFFPYQDDAFKAHQQNLVRQVSSAKDQLTARHVDLDYAKVTLRRSALAKTNRPFSALLKSDYTPIVGALDLGQILVRVSPESLDHVTSEINKSNPETRTRVNKKTNQQELAPNVQRSETGAIERFDIYGPSDRLHFSLDDALAAFKDPRRGGTYYVELFELIPQRSEWDNLDKRLISLFTEFDSGLRNLGQGLVVERLDQTDTRGPFLSARFLTSENPPQTPFAIAAGMPAGRDSRRANESESPPDLSRRKHAQLLTFLRSHRLVRSVRVAPVFERSALTAPTTVTYRTMPPELEIPGPRANQDYPVVAVIDGGLSAALSKWIVGAWNLLQPFHRAEEHGTFIAGLMVSGAKLNGNLVCPESDGCNLVDIDILPSDANPAAFAEYFPAGSRDFFEELENAVLQCRVKYGVRIFNLSINAEQASLDSYSYEARKLDAIAQATDIIIVVSAGNVDGVARPEWDSVPARALSDLAVARDDTILIPAETVRNVSVSALNPVGVKGAISHAPACYTRRGPGLRSGLKPDFSHFGGAKVQPPIVTSGLYSIDPAGATIESLGTSFAAPLVAKTLASLDAKIQGDVSRETLISLLAHHSTVYPPLDDKLFKDIARHLVGFGFPMSSDEMLRCSDHEITLVFAARLKRDKMLRFPFVWPRSLVDVGGKCRGVGRMTLVYSPPLDYNYGSELVRVSLDAKLQQENPNNDEISWDGHAHQKYMQKRKRGNAAGEAELINDGLKWSTVKLYNINNPRGIGKSSNWRIEVDYLTRNLTTMPTDGIPFTLLLTITDPKGESPAVFNEVRQSLASAGTTISDIRTAARVAPRT